MPALSSRANRRQPKSQSVHAVLEPMERRQMLTAAVNSGQLIFTIQPPLVGTLDAPAAITLNDGSVIDRQSDGTVRVSGTAGNDTIRLWRGGHPLLAPGSTYIAVNDQTVMLTDNAAAPIVRFDVDGGDGDDSIAVIGSILAVQPPVVLFDSMLSIGQPYFYSNYVGPAFTTAVSLSGGAGDDSLTGGTGDDTLDGGAGVDRLEDFGGHNQFVLDDNVVRTGDAGRWTEIAGGGYVGATADGTLEVHGTDGPDVISVDWDLSHPSTANEPFDVLINGVSYADDVALPASFVQRIHVDGADGDDSLTVTNTIPFPATLTGGAGDDTLNGDAAADDLQLNPGVTGNPGRPVDRLFGTTPFVIQLAGGGTIAWDPAGFFSIQGTAGNDDIGVSWYVGGYFGDLPQFLVRINGDAWTFRPEAGENVTRVEIDGGDGNDTIHTDQAYPRLTITPLNGANVYSYVGAGPSFATPLLVHGGAGDDTVWGGDGNDTLYGGDGDDRLSAGVAGDDQLFGDAGNDYLFSDSGGADSLYGGAGDDHLRQNDSDALLVPGNPGDQPLPDTRGDWYEFGGGVVAGVTHDGVLYVRGAAGDDAIVVSQGSSYYVGGTWVDVTANGVTQPFLNASYGTPFVSIRVDAGDGNDQVSVGGLFNPPVVVDGGAGDDLLSISHPLYARVTLVGGDGADTLDGDATVDRLEFAGDLQPVFYPPWGPGFPPWDPWWPPIGTPINWLPIFLSEPVPGDPVTPPSATPPSATPPAASGRPVVHSLVLDAPMGQVVTKPGTRVAIGGGSALWRGDGVLVIRGTAGADVIRVGRDARQHGTLLVRVNGSTRAFRVGDSIRRVEVDAGDGDDSVLLGGSDVDGSVFRTAIDLPSLLVGGRGDDTLVGGSKADTLRGGSGADVLTGGAGRDRSDGHAIKERDVIAGVESAL